MNSKTNYNEQLNEYLNKLGSVLTINKISIKSWNDLYSKFISLKNIQDIDRLLLRKMAIILQNASISLNGYVDEEPFYKYKKEQLKQFISNKENKLK